MGVSYDLLSAFHPSVPGASGLQTPSQGSVPPQPLSPPRSSQALANSPWEPLLRGRLHTTLRLRDRCWRTRPTTSKGRTSTSLPFISDVESGGHYEPHGVSRKYSHDTVYQGRGGTPVQESSYHSGGSGAFLKG